MRYLENSFKFLSRNLVIFIPFMLMPIVIIALTITRIIAAIGELAGLGSLFTGNMAEFATNPYQLLGLIAPIFEVIAFIIAISLVLYAIVYPATFGMINKAYSTGSASLADFFPELKKNFVRYIQYFFATILYSIALTIGLGLVLFIVGAILGLLGSFGDVLNGLISFAVNILTIPLSVLVLMWYAVMVTEDCGPFVSFPTAAKALFKRFWSVLGISLLLGIGFFVIAGILALIFIAAKIYILAGIIIFVLSMVYSIITIIYSFEVYRGETYKDDLLNGGEGGIVPETPGDYL